MSRFLFVSSDIKLIIKQLCRESSLINNEKILKRKDHELINFMDENYFKISQTMLSDILNILNEAPHKFVHLPITILQNLELIQESKNNEEELLEG